MKFLVKFVNAVADTFLMFSKVFKWLEEHIRQPD